MARGTSFAHDCSGWPNETTKGVRMQDGMWDREVDLLVAGAGPGGMTAALVAVALNLKAVRDM